jgi:signal peptidase II
VTRRRAADFVLMIAVVLLDQATKVLVDRLMTLHESRVLIDGLLQLTYVRNKGAAFGLFSDAELPFQSVLFSAVSLLALGAIATYFFRLPDRSRLARTALALVMGGALGNLIDRARLGSVIDFVDVFWGTYHWPAFNVADSAISVGVVLLVLDMLRAPHAERSAKSSVPAPAASTGSNE